MTTLRHRLRVCVTTWLAVQAVSLAALPWACCCSPDRDQAAATARPSCHEAATAAHEQETGDTCAMRGACDSPLAAVLAFLSNQGIIGARSTPLPDLDAQIVTIQSSDDTVTRFSPPDPPPPRA
jgi:hypothetical protein